MKLTKSKFLTFLLLLGSLLYYWGKSMATDSTAKETETKAEKSTKSKSKASAEETTYSASKSLSFKELEKYLPVGKNDDEIVRHTAIILSYQEAYEQPSWVLHLLKKEADAGSEERSNQFVEDPLVSTGSAVTQDYARTGYDRGHLCPAGDFKYDKALSDETFYMSNMSPQEPDFNRGIWKETEDQIRKWAKVKGDLVILTGPVLTKNLSFIGKKNKVAVPKYYYKIVYDPRKKQAIAFLMPNQGSEQPKESFVVSIDKIEKTTGIDFFPKLPDSVEEQIEAEVAPEKWFQ